MLTANPKKLRDGSWGAWVNGAPAAGDAVQVTTRSGKSWTATVERVLWTADDGSGAIVATESRNSSWSHRRWSSMDEDHEDCLSMGAPCGPRCGYAHVFRRRSA